MSRGCPLFLFDHPFTCWHFVFRFSAEIALESLLSLIFSSVFALLLISFLNSSLWISSADESVGPATLSALLSPVFSAFSSSIFHLNLHIFFLSELCLIQTDSSMWSLTVIDRFPDSLVTLGALALPSLLLVEWQERTFALAATSPQLSPDSLSSISLTMSKFSLPPSCLGHTTTQLLPYLLIMSPPQSLSASCLVLQVPATLYVCDQYNADSTSPSRISHVAYIYHCD